MLNKATTIGVKYIQVSTFKLNSANRTSVKFCMAVDTDTLIEIYSGGSQDESLSRIDTIADISGHYSVGQPIYNNI